MTEPVSIVRRHDTGARIAAAAAAEGMEAGHWLERAIDQQADHEAAVRRARAVPQPEMHELTMLVWYLRHPRSHEELNRLRLGIYPAAQVHAQEVPDWLTRGTQAIQSTMPQRSHEGLNRSWVGNVEVREVESLDTTLQVWPMPRR